MAGADAGLVELGRLVRQARLGEREAFEALMRQRSRRVFSFAFRILGNAEDSEDVVQECFLRAWLALADFRVGEEEESRETGRRFETWLLKIAYGLAVDAYRRRRRSNLVSLDALPSLPSWETIDSSEALLDLEKLFRMAAPVLTERQRAAFVLCVVEGMDSTEAASIMDTEPSTVRNLVMQARERLRSLLQAKKF